MTIVDLPHENLGLFYKLEWCSAEKSIYHLIVVILYGLVIPRDSPKHGLLL